jgi:hypothetical protein
MDLEEQSCLKNTIIIVVIITLPKSLIWGPHYFCEVLKIYFFDLRTKGAFIQRWFKKIWRFRILREILFALLKCVSYHLSVCKIITKSWGFSCSVVSSSP